MKPEIQKRAPELVGGAETQPGDRDAMARQLERVAELLGCGVEAFRSGKTGVVELDQATELLQLWSAITTEEARERVLACARAAAGEATNR